MDNVTIREIMMMGPNVFFKICFKIIFINNVKKIKQCCHGMSVKPSFPIVVNNIIYVLCEKLGCFENKNIEKKPIVTYDSRLFEKAN